MVDAETRETTEYFARVVFLNASALNTTALLLNSKCRHHPNGFGNSSGVLGHYLMDHHAGLGAFGSHYGYADKYYAGRRSTSVYIPRFRNVTARHPDFTRGYAYEMYTGREGWNSRAGEPGVGAGLQGPADQAGPLDGLDGGLRRVPAPPREPGHALARPARPVGPAGPGHRHDVRPERDAPCGRTSRRRRARC